MSDVKRYYCDVFYNSASPTECELGECVSYDDYKEIEQENQRLGEEIKIYTRFIGGISADKTDLAKALAELAQNEE